MTLEEKQLKQKVYMEKWREKNKEHIKTYEKIHNPLYYLKNKERIKTYARKYSLENKESISLKKKQYRIKTKDKYTPYWKEYYQKNKEKRRIQSNLYYQTHKEEQRIKRREWRDKNRIKIREYHKNYKKIKKETDPSFCISLRLTKRIRQALIGYKKSLKTEYLVGCPFKDFVNYFKSKMTPNMTWEHVKKGLIHIDHIRPCASFDLSDPEQQKICFHYTNLQPLWATTEIAKQNGDLNHIGNINKGDSIIT